MDRRRRQFSPSAEGLENRQLLSTTKATVSVASSSAKQTQNRIEKLPNYLYSLQPGRYIPPSLITALQNDLYSIVGKLTKPASATLTAANLQYRTTTSHASISVQDAAALRATFVNALKSANAPAASIASFTANMDTLVQVDSTSVEPAQLASNDYALILQTALQVGRPLRTPAAPALSPSSNTGSTSDKTTSVTQPKLVGRYDTGTTIQLLNESGQVIGNANVQSNGQYNVKPVFPLAIGKYKLTVRAYDSLNNMSKPSKPITLTIVAPAKKT